VCGVAPYLEGTAPPHATCQTFPRHPRQLSLQKTAALGTQQSNSNPRHADTTQLGGVSMPTEEPRLIYEQWL
jgi:hypothetical protein